MRTAEYIDQRDKLLEEYREKTLEVLLSIRFTGSYDKSTIEQVIFEKVNYLLYEAGIEV